MTIRPPYVAFASFALLLSGCCRLVPVLCPPEPGIFSFTLRNNRHDFCQTEFAVQWQVEYTDINGDTIFDQGSAPAGGTESGLYVDAQKTGEMISQVVARINDSCDENRPVEQWAVLTFEAEIPHGGAVQATIDNSNEISHIILAPDVSSPRDQIVSATRYVTGAQIGASRSEPPAEKATRPDQRASKNKPCCR